MSSIEQPLTETERFAYLQAMDIALWVPRHSEAGSETTESAMESAVESPMEVDASQSQEAKAQTGVNQAQSDSNLTSRSANSHLQENLPDSQAVDSPQVAQIESSAKATESQSAQATAAANFETPQEAQQTDKNITPTKQTVAHYLKMVPWSAGAQSNRSLLIVCRHQTDQPAQSFARPSSPSQFMSDYIQALREFLDEEKDDCFIKMGHLSQAGLGKGCADFDQVLKDVQPKLILVLGDETVKELFDKESEVADLRGKTLMFGEQHPCIVSYHPFSLIKNPSLKKLALEDLKLSAAILLNG